MSDEAVQALVRRLDSLLHLVAPLLPAPVEPIDWDETLAARWGREGRTGALRPLHVKLDLRLDDLLAVDRQRALLVANTRQFVAGLPANHALLWGARGTGKSSLVRALLAAHAGDGLRLIEIERDDLVDLPKVVAGLARLPQRFILFCDDLSFDSGESDYRVLKSVLDGSLEQAPDNVLLYATSNRRHLLPESNSDNQNWQYGGSGEVHPSEAVEDRIALSDRFGLWLSFYSFSQDDFLAAVRHWLVRLAEPHGLQVAWSEQLAVEAARWATARGNRNGRCAYQFARHHLGMLLLAGAGD